MRLYCAGLPIQRQLNFPPTEWQPGPGASAARRNAWGAPPWRRGARLAALARRWRQAADDTVAARAARRPSRHPVAACHSGFSTLRLDPAHPQCFALRSKALGAKLRGLAQDVAPSGRHEAGASGMPGGSAEQAYDTNAAGRIDLGRYFPLSSRSPRYPGSDGCHPVEEGRVASRRGFIEATAVKPW
jgi:hypothetical protein